MLVNLLVLLGRQKGAASARLTVSPVSASHAYTPVQRADPMPRRTTSQ